MDADSRVGFEEFRNPLGLVRTQVIDNNVDFASRRLTGYDLRKEIDELGTGVASTGLSQHLSGLSVERGVKRKRSMAIVFEAMPFGSARRKGQNGVQAIQCLDSALLVGTEYCSMSRRIEVQSNDISCFFFKLRIVRWPCSCANGEVGVQIVATLG